MRGRRCQSVVLGGFVTFFTYGPELESRDLNINRIVPFSPRCTEPGSHIYCSFFNGNGVGETTVSHPALPRPKSCPTINCNTRQTYAAIHPSYRPLPLDGHRTFHHMTKKRTAAISAADGFAPKPFLRSVYAARPWWNGNGLWLRFAFCTA